MRTFFGRRGLRLSQSLGAFRIPGGVSPLYALFGVENASGREVEVSSVRITPKGEDVPLAAEEIEGVVPVRLPAKESVRFEVRAKTLADGEGVEHRRDFALRVDEYLALKDE